MANKRDYYEVLGVARDVNKRDLKKAYHGKARQYHPDVNDDPTAGEIFKEINEAYEVLSDDQKRQVYDRYGHAGLQGAGAGFQDMGGFGMADIFEEFFGGFSGTRRRQRGPRRGADLRYDLTIDFEEAIFGVEKVIDVTRPELCPTCSGSGAEPGTHPERCTNCSGSGEVRRVQKSILGSFVNVSTCPVCQGTGEMVATPCATCHGRKQVQQTRQRSIKVPAGVDNETQLRLTGEGGAGEAGGPPGNLYIFIHVREHPYFRRRGNDILVDLQINVAQAALGDEITIPTVDGEQPLAIPPGSQSGDVFTLPNHGVPYLRREGRGKQLVVVQVVVPKDLTPEQKDLFTQLAKTLGKEVIPQRSRGILESLKEALGDVFGL